MIRRTVRPGRFLLTGCVLLGVWLWLWGGAQASATELAPLTRYVAPGGLCDYAAPCYTNLQAAVDAANSGDTIKVASGTYTGVVTRNGSTQMVIITKNVTVRGGYRVYDWETLPAPSTEPSVLDAQGQGRVMVVTGNSAPVISGLRFTHGSGAQGGGLYVLDAQPSLAWCQFTANQASSDGGGLFVGGSSTVQAENTRIYSNTAGGMGGGLAAGAGSTLTMNNTWMYDNTADERGGGFALSGATTRLVNLLLHSNRVTSGAGAGLAIEGGQATLVHPTIARNTGGDGSGLSVSAGATATVSYAIVAGQTIGVSAAAGSTATLNHTLWGSGDWINGQNTAGAGSISSTNSLTGDPKFSDPTGGNFHITSASAAVDQATGSAILVDFENESRTATGYGSAPDLGADEVKLSGTGTTVIHVDTETGGDIDWGAPPAWDGLYENTRGALFWNGSKWVSNDTAAHIFYTNLRTGERLKWPTLLATLRGSGDPGIVYQNQDIEVTQQLYTYITPALDGGRPFVYTALEYRVRQIDGGVIVVRSRGSGHGLDQAYLDLYIPAPAPIISPTVAIRGGAHFYSYDMDVEAALRVTDPVLGLTANLPSSAPPERARYWLDLNGGSDMGGISYFLRTGALQSQAAPASSVFPLEFRFKYFGSDNSFNEVRILPRIVSEARAKVIYLPLIRRQ
jgi:hypothetical protein